MELGLFGFPFEKLVGKLLVHEEFSAKVGVIVKGYCVQHEVDVIAQKDNNDYMIECKYHNAQGRVCNVKITLYIHSRFLDIEKQWIRRKSQETKHNKRGEQTNKRYKSDEIQ